MRGRALGAVIATTILLGGLCAGGWLRPNEPPPAQRYVAWGRPGRDEPGAFDRPRCVSVAPDGSVYVLDLTGRIQHFTRDGTYLDQMQMPDVSVGRPQGMDVDDDGFIYVADTHYDQIIKFDPSGEIVLRFGTHGTEPGQFFWPCAVHVTDDGTIYTAEYGADHDRVQKWSPAGELLAHWGDFGTAPAEFMRPMGLAVDATGNVYVADAVNHRVSVYSPEGALLRSWGRQGDAAGQFAYPYNIAIDSAGRVTTVEYGGHRVQRFTLEGSRPEQWGGFAPGGAGLNHPWGMDVARDGTVFVADTMSHRVVRIDADALQRTDRP